MLFSPVQKVKNIPFFKHNHAVFEEHLEDIGIDGKIILK
jgi:hypothetical protein